MSAMELLEVLGGVREDYVVQAARLREGRQAGKARRLPVRRVVLVAAVLALAALLVGCTVVYLLRLKDLKMGETVREDAMGTTEVYQMLSMQGVAGTPGYQAGREWHAWLEQYDTDGAVRNSQEAYSEDFGEEYWAYDLYSREMKDKLDEICEAYGLELLGPAHTDTDISHTYQALGISGIFRQDAPVRTGGLGHYYFENGAFKVEGEVTLTGEDSPWTEPVMMCFYCNRKDAFGELYDTVGPVGTYEEWNYTTADGVDVLLVLDKKHATMMVDKGEYFFTVGMDASAGNVLEGWRTMDKKTLEAFAEVFDFTISPHRVSREDMEAAAARREADSLAREREQERAQARLEEFHGAASFDARVKYHLENDRYAGRLGFALRDLDGDGREELLIGRDGYIYYIYAEKDGQTSEIKGPLQSMNPCYLTEDGGFVMMDNTVTFFPFANYWFWHVENGARVMDRYQRYFYDPYGLSDQEGWELWEAESGYRDITGEEFREIAESGGTRVVVPMLPLTQYPLAEGTAAVETPGWEMPDGTDSYAAFIRERILMFPPEFDYKNPPTAQLDWRYALVDLNGDGEEELFWDGVDSQQVLTIRDGQVVCVFSGFGLRLCRGNAVEAVHRYNGENRTYCYYRMEGTQMWLADYLRYDAEADPENPWLRSGDASGQDVSMEPVSMEEFHAVLDRYASLDVQMKPFSEFPLE